MGIQNLDKLTLNITLFRLAVNSAAKNRKVKMTDLVVDKPRPLAQEEVRVFHEGAF